MMCTYMYLRTDLYEGERPKFRVPGRGHVPTAAALLEAGAAVDARSADGSTAALLAAEHGQLPVLRYLAAARVRVFTNI